MRLDGATFGEGGGEEVQHHRPLLQGVRQLERKLLARLRGLGGKIRRGDADLQGGERGRGGQDGGGGENDKTAHGRSSNR